MLERTVQVGLLLAGAYAGIGLLVGVALHASGLRRIDPGVAGAGVFFRLLISPGLVALWPLMLAKWQRAARGGTFGRTARAPTAEGLRTAHRRQASALAFLLPVVAGAALILRPPAPGVAPAPLAEPVALPDVRAELGEILAPLSIRGRLRGDAAGSLQLELLVAEDPEIATPLLYWSPGEPPSGDALPHDAIFLGALSGPGTLRYPLPTTTDGGSLLVYSAVRAERVAADRLSRER